MGPRQPARDDGVAVAPGPRDATGYGGLPAAFFRRVRVVATLTNPDGIHNQEWGGHVYLCSGLRQLLGGDSGRQLRSYS